MYVQVGDLVLVGDHITVPLTRISCNTIFSKSQNERKAGTLCSIFFPFFGKKYKNKLKFIFDK